MIDSRIKIATERPPGLGNEAAMDAYNEAVMAEIVAGAHAAAVATGKTAVRVEVEYPGEIWDESGDALEVDFSTEPPTITTLLPYEEVTP